MSASNKKKLRKEQNEASLAAKQRKEQSEAKKLKVYSTVFIAIISVVVVVALTVMSIKIVGSSGILEKNTIAVTIGDHEINSVTMNYFLGDTIQAKYNEWYNEYGEYVDVYISSLGLDSSTPMNELPHESGEGTWGDEFLRLAMDSAKQTYALYDMAMDENFVLTEEQEKAIEDRMLQTEYIALVNGFEDINAYLKAAYGFGSNENTFEDYIRLNAIAAYYAEAYSKTLTYDDAILREYEAKNYDAYSSYSYATYFVNFFYFQEGGTTDANGVTTYNDEERDAARAAAKEAAESLATATSLADFDKKIAALKINEKVENAASTKNNNVLYSNIAPEVHEWVTNKDRQADEIGIIPREVTSTDADGNEVTNISGYYVVYFQSKTENLEPLANVRHLLVNFEGGTYDSETGLTTYSDEEKATAKKEAENLLAQWESGEATEDSLIALIKEHSDDGSASEGGLIEDITPDSTYVPSFLNWSTDPSREAGDVDIIESDYGYHIVYYVADDELSYRDFLLSSELRTEEMAAWLEESTESISLTTGDTSRVNIDSIFSY